MRRRKPSPKWKWMIMGILCVACFALTVFILNFPNQVSYANQMMVSQPTMIASIPALQKTDVAPSFPARIKIPRIHVNAELEHVGLNTLGEVGVPKGPTNAAWFTGSSRPGETGSAIVVGHYGRWKNGIQTVFNHLDQLKKGDVVTIENKNGAVTAFVVREFRMFASADDAFEVFGMNDGKSHLNLITCEGIWNKHTKSYPNRLVVFMDKQ